MIILRVYRGVADHFHIRVSEWIMVWPAIGLWFGLQLDPAMFAKSASFAFLSSWADESSWSAIIGLCAVFRLAALTINGTFKGFAFSPHIRAAASIVGVAIWSQVSLGFLMAFLFAGGAFSGVIAWSTFVIAELWNVVRSWSDVGKHAARR
ncbi:hypothetical protein [Aureimonas sp. AU20]|uniref:hypothetical protein n=1 Tax=Aureimonas sp. AU20 TaxID=1349819 RepID=UPI00071F7BE2|nr:hypothetical protein [Aureimonas sp. AU20]ALN73514.1 hypothetical protein M673_12390 [Aureimonas sp. AU20]